METQRANKQSDRCLPLRHESRTAELATLFFLRGVVTWKEREREREEREQNNKHENKQGLVTSVHKNAPK